MKFSIPKTDINLPDLPKLSKLSVPNIPKMDFFGTDVSKCVVLSVVLLVVYVVFRMFWGGTPNSKRNVIVVQQPVPVPVRNSSLMKNNPYMQDTQGLRGYRYIHPQGVQQYRRTY